MSSVICAHLMDGILVGFKNIDGNSEKFTKNILKAPIPKSPPQILPISTTGTL